MIGVQEEGPGIQQDSGKSLHPARTSRLSFTVLTWNQISLLIMFARKQMFVALSQCMLRFHSEDERFSSPGSVFSVFSAQLFTGLKVCIRHYSHRTWMQRYSRGTQDCEGSDAQLQRLAFSYWKKWRQQVNWRCTASLTLPPPWSRLRSGPVLPPSHWPNIRGNSRVQTSSEERLHIVLAVEQAPAVYLRNFKTVVEWEIKATLNHPLHASHQGSPQSHPPIYYDQQPPSSLL